MKFYYRKYMLKKKYKIYAVDHGNQIYFKNIQFWEHLVIKHQWSFMILNSCPCTMRKF